MAEKHLSTLLQLRLLVGMLGERTKHSWWQTGFYEPTSQQFLDPIFAKTARLAQYHGVVEAARRIHDEHLSVGCYHLFRLPEEVEQDLHALLLSSEGNDIAAGSPRDKDSALAKLADLSGGAGKLHEGPIAVGPIKHLNSPNVVKAIAGAYRAAFLQDSRSYPYLAS